MPARAALADLLRAARRTVLFTGAGMSTESGIPDFRSPGGVWSRMQPITFQEFTSSEAKRREAWTRVFSGAAGWTGAEPNAGHRVIADWVAARLVSSVITQNVDDLHQVSGIPAAQVIELHGNASYATCLDCGLRHELDDLRSGFVERGVIPACRACGGLVKTATISFGQSMPQGPMERAQDETLACDLFLVIGSSLAVYPAAGFPLLAKRNGSVLAILNRDPTDQDEIADLVLHAEIGQTLTEVAGRLSSRN